MRNALRNLCWLLVGAACVGSVATAFADVLYDNSENDLLTRFNPGSSQVGSEINLSGSGQSMTYFSFEFYAINTINPSTLSSADINADVIFYDNTGAPYNTYATPNNVLYNSGSFSVSGLLYGSPTTPTTRDTIIFNESDFGGPLSLGGINTLTWTVQFSGLGAGDEVGLDIYGPPTVGSNHGDYWLWNGTSWELDEIPGFAPGDAFASVVQGTLVPEPSVFALASLGGFGLLAFLRRLRRAG
jgi:hypothetical protein